MKLQYVMSAIGALCSMFASAQSLPELSLDDCLKIALDKSPTVKVADMEVKRMDYSKREVIGQLLPSIDFAGQYGRTLEKQTMYMNMDDFQIPGMGGGDATGGEEAAASKASSKKDNGIKVGLDNSYSLGFQGSLPLVVPQLWKSVQISDQQILLNVEKAQQSRQTLVNQVKAAYYAHLLALDSRKVLQESYEMAEFTNNMYKKLFEAGAASDYDVLRSSVALKNIEPQLLQGDIAIKQTMLQLQILMGVDATFQFNVSDRLSNYEDTMYEQTIAAISNDYSNNADLKILDVNKKILDKTVAVQKLAYSPTLALSANYNWTAMNNGTPFKNLTWNPYSSIGVAISVPILSSGQRYHKVKQAQVQAAELTLQRLNLDRSIAMQVDLAIDNIKINVQQIASCSESVGQADRAHNIMQESFKIGSASYLELRDSELSLTRARLDYYQAIYNYLVATNDLELLQGTAPIEKYTTEK